MVKRHGSLVGEENLPFVELDGIFCGAWRGEESLRERLRERAAGYSYLEGVMAVEACCLAGDDIGSEGSGKRINGGKCEEVWLSCHLDDPFRRVVVEECGWCVPRSAIDSWLGILFISSSLQGSESMLDAWFQWQQRRVSGNDEVERRGEVVPSNAGELGEVMEFAGGRGSTRNLGGSEGEQQ